MLSANAFRVFGTMGVHAALWVVLRVEPRKAVDASRAAAGQAASDSIDIPYAELSPDALRGIIEAFVLREGTEYGERDFSLAEKVAQVQRQLERGEARIVYAGATRSVDIRAVEARAGSLPESGSGSGDG